MLDQPGRPRPLARPGGASAREADVPGDARWCAEHGRFAPPATAVATTAQVTLVPDRHPAAPAPRALPDDTLP